MSPPSKLKSIKHIACSVVFGRRCRMCNRGQRRKKRRFFFYMAIKVVTFRSTKRQSVHLICHCSALSLSEASARIRLMKIMNEMQSVCGCRSAESAVTRVRRLHSVSEVGGSRKINQIWSESVRLRFSPQSETKLNEFESNSGEFESKTNLFGSHNNFRCSDEHQSGGTYESIKRNHFI